MRFLSLNALTASTLLLAASSATANAFEELAPRAGMVYVACYSNSDGFGNQVHFQFQSTGWCYTKCSGSNFKAFALTQGSQCQCGNTLPPESAKVPDSHCNTPCDGWPSAMCGGSGFWSVYSTGLGPVSPVSASTTTAGGGNDTTAATQTDQTATSVSTNSGGQTVVVTETSHNNGNSNSNPNSAPSISQTPSSGLSNVGINAKTKSSHNTAAIAAGVVVGVVGLAALAGGVFFFIRSRKQKAAGATGYRRNSRPPSMSDSRFDGSYMAHRRQSNGSIDDDHDFSRRILQVTNPDR